MSKRKSIGETISLQVEVESRNSPEREEVSVSPIHCPGEAQHPRGRAPDPAFYAVKHSMFQAPLKLHNTVMIAQKVNFSGKSIDFLLSSHRPQTFPSGENDLYPPSSLLHSHEDVLKIALERLVGCHFHPRWRQTSSTLEIGRLNRRDESETHPLRCSFKEKARLKDLPPIFP